MTRNSDAASLPTRVSAFRQEWPIKQHHDSDTPRNKDQHGNKKAHVSGTTRPVNFFNSTADSGQAARPENMANQPFVIGHGP